MANERLSPAAKRALATLNRPVPVTSEDYVPEHESGTEPSNERSWTALSAEHHGVRR